MGFWGIVLENTHPQPTTRELGDDGPVVSEDDDLRNVLEDVAEVGDDQGHLGHLLEDRATVVEPPVLCELFAVVGDHDDDGPISR